MSPEAPDMEPHDQEPPLDPAVTLELFLQWRAPRFGRANPERMNNPVWEWLIRSRLSAYSATQRLGGPSAIDDGPGWCFDRFGQSSTTLPDGRTVLIGGEHEDYYDPDFFIYNDVVVLHPDGHIDLLGYSKDDFPPTDFHTATLVGNSLIMIGCLGYSAQRKPGTTPILVLDLASFAISSAHASGRPPGWIHGHEAVLEENGRSILVRGGKLDRGGEDHCLVENIDDWRLHLADWRWERLTERRWPRCELVRKDQKPNHLWEIQQVLWSRSVGWNKEVEEEMKKLVKDLGARPDLDLADKLFSPAIPHEPVPKDEEEYNITRIRVNGTVARYVADVYSIQMTVEGELEQDAVEALAADLAEKLALLENAPIEVKWLD